MTSFQAWQKPSSKSASDRDIQNWDVVSGAHETVTCVCTHRVTASIGLAFWLANATKYILLFNTQFCWGPHPNILGKQFSRKTSPNFTIMVRKYFLVL